MGKFDSILVGGSEEKEVNRLHDAIIPYITKNLRPYIMQPPVRSRGDWGQSQFQLGGVDESTHQILSYGLLFSTFYRFLHTADLLTCTTPMRPSMTFVQSLLTIPYTIAPSVQYHVRDLPYDLWTTLLYFPYLVSSLLSNASFHGPTDHRSSHHAIGTLPYASPHTNLVLVLLIICI